MDSEALEISFATSLSVSDSTLMLTFVFAVASKLATEPNEPPAVTLASNP